MADSKRQIVRIDLDCAPHNDTLLLSDLNARVMKEVPEQYRGAVTLGHESGSYDSGDIFRIYYDRPETDEEMTSRIANEQAYETNAAAQREARDRAEFERLKQKFGNR